MKVFGGEPVRTKIVKCTETGCDGDISVPDTVVMGGKLHHAEFSQAICGKHTMDGHPEFHIKNSGVTVRG